MPLLILVILLGAIASQGLANWQPAATGQKDSKAPTDILSAAAPLYDFTDFNLKPWHLKASYLLYDEKGKHPEQGTFEYWWVAPSWYRISWARSGAGHTDC